MLDWDGGALWPYIGTKDIGVRQQLFHCPSDVDPRVCVFVDSRSPTQVRNFSYVFSADLYQMTGQIMDASVPSYLQHVGASLQQIKGPEHKVLTAECNFSLTSGGIFLDLVSGGYNSLPAWHSGRAFVGMADGHVELFGPKEFSNPMAGPTVTIAGAKVPPQYSYYFLIYR